MSKDFIVDNTPYRLGKDQDGSIKNIQDIHPIVFSIMVEIDRICRKNNIQYALAFGSALGLHNYQGFIPWDDDADIAIDYFDIPRLVEAFKKDLSDEFEFVCYETDNRYNVLIPTFKVKKKVGYMQDKNWYVIPDRTKSYEGFFVDIVAFMGMKDAKTHRKLISKSQRRLVGYFISDGIFRIDPVKLKKKMKEEERQIAEKYKNANFVCQTVIIPFQRPKVNLYPREMIYPFREYEFNGHKFYSFNNVVGFCLARYGEGCLKHFDGEKYVDYFPKKYRIAQHVRRFHIPKDEEN